MNYSEIPFSKNSYHIETSQLMFFAKPYRNDRILQYRILETGF